MIGSKVNQFLYNRRFYINPFSEFIIGLVKQLNQLPVMLINLMNAKQKTDIPLNYRHKTSENMDGSLSYLQTIKKPVPQYLFDISATRLSR